MHIGKTGLTKKQQRFAEGIALEGLTKSDAYRRAYNTKGLSATVNPHASRLANSDKIKATIDALTLANQAMEYADAESIRKLVIQSLIQTVIDPDVKAATKVAAAKVLGTVTEVAAFTERKQITNVNDSSAIREQIMSQLKHMILDTGDAETVDADALLHEISGEAIDPANENGQDDSPTLWGDATFATGTPPVPLHSNPLEQFPPESEHPPSSPETQTPGGDISGENT
jgi:hypothetical protein